MIGFAMPFIVLGVLLHVLAQLTVIIAIPLLVGIVLVGRGVACCTMRARGGETRGATRERLHERRHDRRLHGAHGLRMSGFGTAGYRGGFY